VGRQRLRVLRLEELEELLVDEPVEELRVAVRRSDEAIDRRGDEIR